MDFSTINLGIPEVATQQTIGVTDIKVGSAVIQNGDGMPLVLTMLSPLSSEYERQQSMWVKKHNARLKADENDTTDRSELTDDELSKLIAQEDEVANELWGRIVTGWNLSSGGEPVKFTKKSLKSFFAANDLVRKAFISRAAEVAAELGKSLNA